MGTAQLLCTGGFDSLFDLTNYLQCAFAQRFTWMDNLLSLPIILYVDNRGKGMPNIIIVLHQTIVVETCPLETTDQVSADPMMHV